MANKNNFVKLRLIRTFTMTNLAILLSGTCVRVNVCVCDPACEGAHEYLFFFTYEHVFDSLVMMCAQ